MLACLCLLTDSCQQVKYENMSKNAFIEENKARLINMTPDERQELGDFLVSITTPPRTMTEEEADNEAMARSERLLSGNVKPMTHEEVFEPLRKKFA